jgi:hypothetical protein
MSDAERDSFEEEVRLALGGLGDAISNMQQQASTIERTTRSIVLLVP